MKPLFSYVGGKTFLKNKLVECLKIILDNNNFKFYEEWFAGGLGSFFALSDTLMEYKIKDILLNDINKNLIYLYSYIYNGSSEKIINEYIKIENEFHSFINKDIKEIDRLKNKDLFKEKLMPARDFYKSIVLLFNSSNNYFDKAVYLIFLQNHCFNGIYRENQKGQYNTPFNWEARLVTKEIVSEKINNILNCFSNFKIEFSAVDFSQIKESNSVIYLDPPYLNKNNNENSYHKESFGLDRQIELLEKIKNYKYIYSNHNDERIRNYFNNNLFNNNLIIETVNRKNIISASSESRKNDKVEILVIQK